MTRSLIIGGLAGLASAVLMLTVGHSLFGILLSYLAPLPLLLAGLTHGVLAVGIAGAVGTLISGLAGLSNGALFLTFFAAPAALLVRQALLARPAAEAEPQAEPVAGKLEWYPAGRLVLWLVGWAIGLFALALLVTAGNEGGLPGTIQPAVEKMLGAFLQALPEMGEQVAPADLAATLAPMLPSAMAFGWLVGMVINGVLAQGLAVLLKQNRRPSPQYRALVLPRFLVALLAIAAVATFVLPHEAAFVAVLLTTVFAFPYLLQGLAVVHGLAARTAVPGLLLAAFYAALVVGQLGALIVVLMVILGLIEEWAGFRRRLAGTGTSRENN